MLSGNNSILNRGVQAKEKKEEANFIEQVRIDILGKITEKNGNDITYNELQDILKKYFHEEDVNGIVNLSLVDYELTTKANEHRIKLGDIINGVKIKTLADEIRANPTAYYGRKVLNYTEGGRTYRIFYVDTTGEFGVPSLGTGRGTIYLKADWSANDTSLSSNTNYSPVNTAVMEKLNKKWWDERGQYKDSTDNNKWRASERCAAYLCDPTTAESTSNRAWSEFFNEDKANYVIASPTVEIYIKSYNDVPHNITGNYTLGTNYRATASPGYIYTISKNEGGPELPSSNRNDYITGNDSLDYTDYHSIYCGKNGQKGQYYTWLASPSSYRFICDNYVE